METAYGKVTAVSPLTVQFNGTSAADAVAGVLAVSYEPVVGDIAMMVRVGPSWAAVGAVGAAGLYVKTAGGDTITASGAAVKPLVVKGAAGQTANLAEFQDSAGAVLTGIEADGILHLYNGATTLRISAGAGGAIASGTSAGSINITVDGVARRIPYF